MEMGYDGPSSLVQQGHEAAGGFGCIVAALPSPDHHPGDFGRAAAVLAADAAFAHVLAERTAVVPR